jgi:hypothetical protein
MSQATLLLMRHLPPAMNEGLAADPQSLRLGFYQALRLFAPYISDRDKEDFDRMVEAYT